MVKSGTMKNLIRINTIILIFLMGSMLSTAQGNECEELIAFRNKDLIREYKKTLVDYRLNEDLIKTIKDIEKDLNEGDGIYKGIFRPTSELWVFVTGVKAVSNAIEGTLSLASIKGVKNATKIGKSLYELVNVYKKYKFQYDISNAISSEKIEEQKKVYTILAKQMGTIVKKVVQLHENMQLLKEQKVLKKDVRNSLNMCKLNIRKYNNLLKEAETNLNFINRYISDIDNYLKNHCEKEVTEDPIDIESQIWSLQDENIDIASLNFKLNALLNDPNFALLYDFSNPSFMTELMQLIDSVKYNSTNIDDYINKLIRILEKYRLNVNDQIMKDLKKSLDYHPNVPKINRKPQRKINVPSYSDFKNSISGKNKFNRYPLKNGKTRSNNAKKNKCPKNSKNYCTISA